MSHRNLLVLSVVFGLVSAISLCAYGAWGFYSRMAAHREVSRSISEELKRLAKRRPADVRKGSWEYAIGWTINLHANCGWFYGQVPTEELQGFHSELRAKMDHRVDLELIDWIWDQYVGFSPQGRAYSDRFRPTASPDFRDAPEGCFLMPVD